MSTVGAAGSPKGRGAPAAVHVPSQSVVRRTITSIPRRERLVLALYYYENLGPETIAGALGTPLGEVQRMLDHGKAALARVLSQRDSRSGAEGTHVA
jgi:DNA-directed RNA polymerase specialized sigma24 family protein